MACRYFKYLPGWAASDKVLYDKAFKIVKTSWKIIYIYIDKTTVARANKSATYYTGEGSNPENQQLPEKLHKPIIRKFEKPNVYSSITDNILGSDLADIQCITK